MSENIEKCPYCDGECDLLTCPKYLAYKEVQKPEAVKELLESLGVNPDADPLTLMMAMQKSFAEKFHAVDGLTKDEVDHWVKAYDMCISDEHAEVLEHLNLVIGDDAKVDHYELQKEFIDQWHFLMDQFLVAGLTVEKMVTIYDQLFAGNVLNSANPLKAIFINERNHLNNKYNGSLSLLSKDQIELEILIHSNQILLNKSKVMKEISWKHWKKPAATINYDKLHEAFVRTFRSLIQCFILTNLDDKGLTEIYVTKNCENQFRQAFGY